MKKLLNAFAMCFTMFCAIPSPFSRVWDDAARPLMTLFLPVVGAWIGLLWTGLAYLARLLGLPALVTGAILCAYPFLVTGGIHMDGFLDVTDAVKSWRDAEERRRILKDPHVGSFAVIAGILLVMIQFALFSSVREDAKLFALLLRKLFGIVEPREVYSKWKDTGSCTNRASQRAAPGFVHAAQRHISFFGNRLFQHPEIHHSGLSRESLPSFPS